MQGKLWLMLRSSQDSTRLPVNSYNSQPLPVSASAGRRPAAMKNLPFRQGRFANSPTRHPAYRHGEQIFGRIRK
ncbi:MAG: hypothetical protein LBB79_09445 [Prevotellaceae bacterium]|nr:hypothetical protein [Prevotellaceae bacterium]